MSDVMEIIFSILATAFDMVITMLFFRTCMIKKHDGINNSIFYSVFLVTFAVDMSLRQFGAAGMFYAVKSLTIYILLSLMYDTKWRTRIFTAVSFLVFQMISEVISYFIVVSTIHKETLI